MKTKTHSRIIVFTLLMTLIFLTLCGAGTFIFEITGKLTHTALANSAEDRHKDHSVTDPIECPSPTVPADPQNPQNGQCVLTKNEEITAPLVLASNTKLDCKGQKLFTVTNKDETVGLRTVTHSQPEVGIFLNGVQSVQIQNCTITGFDFGIFDINSKVSTEVRSDPAQLSAIRNRITNNVNVTARYVAISLVSVDNTEVSNNNLTFTTVGGRGVSVERDSDLNTIQHNDITANFTGAIGAYRAPGQWRWPFDPAKPRPSDPLQSGSAIFVAQADSTLLNTIIEGNLYQLIAQNSSVPNRDFTEDNLVADNVIKCLENNTANCATANDGIALGIAQRTIVRGNTITNARAAIRAGIQTGLTGLLRQFPGRCSSTGRLCISTTNDDCNISNFDGSNMGTCVLPPTQTTYWFSGDNAIEGNTINGPFKLGIVLAGNGTIVRGNKINGIVNGMPAGDGIVLMGSFPLETTTMTRNTVSNVVNALTLQKVFNQTPGITELLPVAFGARITLNNFVGYTTAVLTAYTLKPQQPANGKIYDLSSELSVNGQGNYWGLSCTAGGFNQSKVLKAEDNTTNTLVTDSHPFGGPVAQQFFILPRLSPLCR